MSFNDERNFNVTSPVILKTMKISLLQLVNYLNQVIRYAKGNQNAVELCDYGRDADD